ncbi:tRNA pseudouridine(38-40) synthase TruA [Desertivirga brevis]|uniref:tRNA pseudouridine(38-40) synthase TruA n=1 Tax=Desertivirga brevis TaxID=2810310 RepID=UPI001A958803
MQQITRYFIELAYNGTAYHGWQVQPNATSVQELLDKALSIFFRQKIETVGCGRTDTGVHATQFFAHFDLVDKIISLEQKEINGINALLPFDIAVFRFIKVGGDSHARFDATSRSYQYHIHQEKNPFKHNHSWLVKDDLDIEEMNKAAKILFQYIDFSCFSKSNTQVFTNNCKIIRAEWERTSNGYVFHISADRFLRNMVRAIVGTLLEIGRDKLVVEDLHTIIKSKSRSNAGTSVPACGLYLTSICYPYIQERNKEIAFKHF